MKTRLLPVVAALALTLVGMGGPASAAGEAQQGAAALNCQHSQGAGTVVSAAYISNSSTGAVQLCKSGSYYWGYMVKYSSMPTGYWGYLAIDRYDGDRYAGSWNCDSSGGNGYVAPGQTMCWTPRLYAPSTSTKFRVFAEIIRGDYPNDYGPVAAGKTALTR